jgi:arginase family enzyme
VEECAKALSDLPLKDRLLGMEVVEFTPRNDDAKEDAESAMHLIFSLVTAVTGVVV